MDKQYSISEIISERMKLLRKHSGYSQEYVGSCLHVTRQAYSHYERCRRNLTLDNLMALSALYNVPADLIIDTSATSEELLCPSPARREVYLIRRHLNRFTPDQRRKLLRKLAAELNAGNDILI